MKTPPEILNAVADTLDVSIADLASKIGYDRPQALYDVINGKTKKISGVLANRIAETYPNFNNTWLLTGKGLMLKSSDTPYSVNQDHHGAPYYDVDFIGGFDLATNDQTANPAYHIQFQAYDKADCWVNITGHSMEPLINHGDIVALKQIEDWQTYMLYGETYAVVTDEYRTVKKVRKSTKGDDFLRLVPSNTDYDEQDINKSIIRQVYQVLGCAKKIF